MTTPHPVRAESAHAPAGGARGLIRWICTSNPFYVLSAGLFLAGLWISFGDPAQAEDTWAMMTGLTGYTLLLAVTAFLLVRFCKVWDDIRTVLLLVVLMFLATSVTFDQLLALHPRRGFVCYLSGLLFAVAVSESVLRGIRLALPACYRVPYYLILSLFFVYPLALSPLLARPRSEELMWGLFGFATVAGLVFLTLLPAVRRGPACLRNNGSPWPWPLYPWVLFGLLGLAIPARAFLLCWSMQLLDGPDRFQLIFGPYFVIPFGLAAAVLLLESGLVSGHRGMLGVALAAPLLLLDLALAGHRSDPIYQGFLGMFTERLGGDPLYLTLLAAAGFYLYALLRRAPFAAEALTATLLLLAFVGPEALSRRELGPIEPAAILAAGLLQLALGCWRRSSWRCLVGGAALVIVATLVLSVEPDAVPLRRLILLHLILTALLIIGAAFDDALARLARAAGIVLVLLACLGATFARFDPPAGILRWEAEIYPLVMAVLLAAYGLLLGYRFALVAAGGVLACWTAAAGWRGYAYLRQVVAGVDYLVIGLALFVLALLVSLAKSGLLLRWWTGRLAKEPLQHVGRDA